MASLLSQADVTRLLQDPSSDARADTASKLANDFNAGDLTAKEREIAESILRTMVGDAEVRVREALAIHLKESDTLPKDIALSLSRDVDSVALPMLEYSSVLSDEDLIEIVRSQGESKQVAIAKRKEVGSELADALVETDNRDVVATLASNEGADISDASYDKVIEKFGEDESVGEALVGRARLPVTVSERLVHMVSDRLRDQLVARHELPPEVASDLVMQSRERATIGLLSGEDGGMGAADLVQHLKSHERLTPSIVLRALCMGDMEFFEHSMACLAGISVDNAQLLIHDPGNLGLQNLYKKANLPASLYEVFRMAVNVAHETEYDGGENDRERYSRRMIERILTQYQDFESDNLEYLLSRLSQLSEAAA